MSKTRVLLISFNWADHFSLALGYLKAYALKDKFIQDRAEIEIVDFDTEGLNVQQVVYYIAQSKPDIVGFSCYCWNIGRVLDTARITKKVFPSIKVILGGPEAGPIGQKYLAENPFIDAVVKGEGEHSFADLLRYYLGEGTLDEIPGVRFRKNSQIIENQDRPPIENLADIPSPYLEGILVPRDKVT